MNGRGMIRAVYRTTTIPELASPHNQITAKIHFPAVYGDTDAERNSGVIPVDLAHGPMPVAIIAPGINLPFEAYAWLGQRLAEAGIVTVCYQVIGEVMPGDVNLTPALDIAAVRADSAFDRPSGLAFQPLLDLLAKENGQGILTGALDLSNVWFGGHSAGGTTALLNSNRLWFPGLRGVFTYGAHTGLSTMLGHPEGYLHPVKDIPVLLMGGTRDGCIANSASRYGDESGDANGRVVQTFEQAIGESESESYLALIGGANHFTFAHPVDPSTGRAFIDFEEECDGAEARDLIARATIAFIRGESSDLADMLAASAIAVGRRKQANCLA